MASQPQGFEVFLRNVPEELTHSSLEKQLEPIMQSLAISMWICEKPKKKKIAFLIFYNVSDGRKFLGRHGEIPLHSDGGLMTSWGSKSQSFMPTKSRLFLMGKNIYCKESDKQPDMFAVRGILKAVEQRHKRKARPSYDETLSLSTNGLDCGHYMYLDGKFTFIAEWGCRGQGSVQFTQRGIVMNLPWIGVKVRMEYRQIKELLWYSDGTITVTLYWVPIFLQEENPLEQSLRGLLLRKESTQRAQPKARVLSIDRAHAKVSHLCLVYRLYAQAGVDFAHAMDTLKGMDRVNVNRHNTPVKLPQPPVASPYHAEYDMLKLELQRLNEQNMLPFGILFSLQALVDDAFLHPKTVRVLAGMLETLFFKARQEKLGIPVSVNAMKKLFVLIPFPRFVYTIFRYGISELTLDCPVLSKAAPACSVPMVFLKSS